VSQPPWGPPPPDRPPYPPPYLGPWPYPPPYPPPRKSNAGLIIGLVVVAVVVMVGVVLIVALARGSSGRASAPSEQSAQQPKSNSTRAEDVSDMNVVCDGGTVDNAAVFERPHRIVVFRQANQAGHWDEVSPSSSAPYSAEDVPVRKVDVVACLTRRAGSELKIQTCNYKTSDKNVDVDYYGVDYDFELREAATGTVIQNLGPVAGEVTPYCPFIATFERSAQVPKIYAEPNADVIEAKLAAFTG
jgi:hypothetical protein